MMSSEHRITDEDLRELANVPTFQPMIAFIRISAVGVKALCLIAEQISRKNDIDSNENLAK
jgi:hypothetical protein